MRRCRGPGRQAEAPEKTNDITIGIDISKDWLDVHRWPEGQSHRFANDARGHRALLRWLAGLTVARVVHEPTGPYHGAVERALDSAGLPLVKVNPRHARRFAEARGTLAKTDRIDAESLAQMGRAFALEPRPLPSRALRELRELQIARRALVKDRTAAKARAKALSLGLLKRTNAARLRQIDAQLAAIDAEIARRIAENPELRARCRILCSIPGIAAVTAAAMLIEMPELGTLDRKQVKSGLGIAAGAAIAVCASVAAAEESFPRISGEGGIEVQNDLVFEADDESSELNDLYTTIEPAVRIEPVEHLAIVAGLVLEPVQDASGEPCTAASSTRHSASPGS